MKNIFNNLKNPQVFLSKIATQLSKVSNAMRQKEIDDCSNSQVKLEKYTSWQLLKVAVEQTFGVPIEMLNVRKDQSGKWVCDEFYFSISHSKEVCAVVVDNQKVGIDVQLAQNDRFDDAFAKRICTQKELLLLENGHKNLQTVSKFLSPINNSNQIKVFDQVCANEVLSLWCKKEALFKGLNLSAFVPKELDTTTASFVEKFLLLDDDEYLLVVATDKKDVDTHLVEIE